MTLEEGYPLQGIALHADGPAAAAAKPLRGELELAFDRDALSVTMTVRDPDYRDDHPPWAGGCGILVNLIRPLSPDDYESQRYHALGFGTVDGEPRGWLVAHDGEVLLQPLSETRPTIERRGDTIVCHVSIEWEVFHPYAPPLDQDMGLNVFYLGAGDADRRPILSLMSEDRLSFEPEPWRRYVPIAFLTSDRSRPVLRGRLYDRLVEQGEVGVEFALWSLVPGSGAYRLAVVDRDGAPVADPPPRVVEVACEEGLNFFNETVGLGELPSGAYRLEVALEGPDGLPMVFHAPFSRFPGDWLGSLNERIHRLPGGESQILRYHLFVLGRDLDRRHPQDDTAPLRDAYRRLAAMVDVCEAGGSCLPESGLLRGGFAVDTATQRLCAMYLPPGHRGLRDPRLLIVIPPQPGVEMDLAVQLGAELADSPDVIVLVPQSHGITGLTLDMASAHAELATIWARDLFATDAVTLVGLESGADAALAVSLARPDLFDRVLLGADHLFLEDARFSAETLYEILVDRRNDLPYIMVSRLAAGDRVAEIEDAMRDLGFRVVVVPIVDGTADAVWIGERLAP